MAESPKEEKSVGDPQVAAEREIDNNNSLSTAKNPEMTNTEMTNPQELKNLEMKSPEMKNLDMKNPETKNADATDGYQEHSFLVNQTYFEDMEERLMKLLDTFKRGELTAFDKNYSLDKLKEVKERQEKLAQMHFDLENEEVNKAAGSEEDKAKRTQEKMDKLMKNMENLCSSVQSLHQHPEGD